MGRRSTRTTKTGKFMNPTDQWRKQQRRRELKKNKKQRRVVREAVLRMKDVGQMLDEIEEIEKIQMTSLGTETLPNEKGLEEKKEKLHATIHRVSQYYQIEDPKKAQELKLLVMESEKRRREMSKVYNSYRAARSQFSIDEIPLPDSGGGESVLPSDIPMPVSIEDELPTPVGLLPPGPPSSPPPSDLPEYVVIESERKSVRFAESAVEDGSDSSDDDDLSTDSEEDDESGSDDDVNEPSNLVPPGPPPGLPPQNLSAPPLHPPPPLIGQNFPPRLSVPPGPPPGMPPPMYGGGPPRPLMPPSASSRPHIQSGAVLKAPPTKLLMTEEETEGVSKPTSAVISAQPQLRNMTAEVTKFMPTSLRVRRYHPIKNKLKPKTAGASVSSGLVPAKHGASSKLAPGVSQGDAYDAFMKEMQGLL